MRRRALPAAVGVAVAGFVVLQLITGASLGAARRSLDEGRRSLATAAADRDQATAARADRVRRARAAEEGLDHLRARLGQLQLAVAAGAGPAVADLVSEIAGARADLDGANVRLWERSSEVGALRACFVSVTQALSLISLDHRDEALDVLGSAAPRCREAGAAR